VDEPVRGEISGPGGVKSGDPRGEISGPAIRKTVLSPLSTTVKGASAPAPSRDSVESRFEPRRAGDRLSAAERATLDFKRVMKELHLMQGAGIGSHANTSAEQLLRRACDLAGVTWARWREIERMEEETA
jgi:hypothetical protein